MERHQIAKKEVKLPLFTDGLILFVENSKESIPKISLKNQKTKLLELLNMFSKFEDPRLKHKKAILLLYTVVPLFLNVPVDVYFGLRTL